MKHFSASIGWAAPAVRLARLLTPVRRLLLLAGLAAATPAAGQGTVIAGPANSVSFGSKVMVLPNGNFVVADPGFNSTRGAVYLYRGSDGTKLSTLSGSKSGDQVGSGGMVVLANGNFLVSSPQWNGNGTASNALGAVTWMDATGNGGNITVSASNSLVGNTAGDQVGYAGAGVAGVVALANGNYLVRSPGYQSGGLTNAGAVTWGNGSSSMGGVRGAVSASNSLVGRYAYDNVGGDYTTGASTAGLVLLANSNYVVVVPSYRGDPTRGIRGYGAVAWGSGTAGVVGTIGTANSLLGNAVGDEVGVQGVTALPGGNYLISSPTGTIGTASQAGAVTWGSGTAGVKGIVSASNSLVGSTTSDVIGNNGTDPALTPLPNGNYVVFSPAWDNKLSGTVADAGALTLGDGNGGTVGAITGCNSIVGSVASQGSTLSFSYNPVANNILGGLPAENKVVLGVAAPAAPTGTANQQYTAGATVADLQATGTAVQWYAASGGGSPLASTTPLVNGSIYYATQTVGSCESLSRLAVRVADPLPVQLTTFTATAAGPAAVQVRWSTASEKNSQAFEVERSLSGTSFERIGTVAAAGSSSSPRSYELLDAQLPASATQLYYRLRQLDRDGTASYSPVRVVALSGTTLTGAAAGLSLYPNPLPGGATTLAGAQPGTVATVYDALGRLVTSATADAAGTAALVLPPGLPAGVYVVRAGARAVRLTVE